MRVTFNFMAPHEQARALELANPDWMITWSWWREEFVAFPTWPGHGGGYVVAKTARELERRMRVGR
jgi:hypothetical protein